MPIAEYIARARRRRRRLREIEPDKVDLVDHAANKRKFMIIKEDTMPSPTVQPPVGVNGVPTMAQLDEALSTLKELETQVAELRKAAGEDPAPVADPAADPVPDPVVAPVVDPAPVADPAVDPAVDPDPDPDADPVPDPAVDPVPDPAVDPDADPTPDPEPVAKDATMGAQLREFAEMGINTAHMLIDFGEMDPQLLATIEEQLGSMMQVADSMAVAKAANSMILPTPFGIADADKVELLKAAGGVLRALAQDASILSMTTQESVSDIAKAQVGRIKATMDALMDGLPTEVTKSVRGFSRTLRTVAERALTLCTRAEEAKGIDKRTMREAQRLRDMVQGLVDKHNVTKADSESDVAPDMALLIEAERNLDTVEDAIVKAEPAPEPELAPVADPTLAPVADPAVDPEVDPTEADELKKSLEAAQSRIDTLQAYITKARDSVGLPAADDGDDADPDSEDAFVFPRDYNTKEQHEVTEQLIAKRKGA